MPKIINMPPRFDYSAMSHFNAEISAALQDGNKKILLDCTHMDYIDSSGLGLLVMAYKRALENQCQLAVINIKPAAQEVLLLANLQKLMDIN